MNAHVNNTANLPKFWCYADDPTEIYKSREFQQLSSTTRCTYKLRIVRWLRSGKKCKYCGVDTLILNIHTAQVRHPDMFTYDHIEPRMHCRGTPGHGTGIEANYNIIGACSTCNTLRGSRSFDYFVEKSVHMTRKQLVMDSVKREKWNSFNNQLPKFVHEQKNLRIAVVSHKYQTEYDHSWTSTMFMFGEQV